MFELWDGLRYRLDRATKSRRPDTWNSGYYPPNATARCPLLSTYPAGPEGGVIPTGQLQCNSSGSRSGESFSPRPILPSHMPKHAMTGFHRAGLPPASDGPLAHSDELTGLTPLRSIPIPFSHGLTPEEAFAAAATLRQSYAIVRNLCYNQSA